jgi:fucose permease
MLLLIVKPLTIVFIISIFMYVLIEQSFQTWLPTFYQDILKTPASMAVQAGASLAGVIMIGRFLGGILLKHIKWIHLLSVCLILAGVIIVLVLPLAKNVVLDESTNWMNAPLAAYLLPILGLFLAPIYPTLNSTILSALPKYMHSSMAGLIVVFSALGGTFGSMITGSLFDVVGGNKVFYFSLIPLTLIFISIWILNKLVSKKSKASI